MLGRCNGFEQHLRCFHIEICFTQNRLKYAVCTWCYLRCFLIETCFIQHGLKYVVCTYLCTTVYVVRASVCTRGKYLCMCRPALFYLCVFIVSPCLPVVFTYVCLCRQTFCVVAGRLTAAPRQADMCSYVSTRISLNLYFLSARAVERSGVVAVIFVIASTSVERSGVVAVIFVIASTFSRQQCPAARNQSTAWSLHSKQSAYVTEHVRYHRTNRNPRSTYLCILSICLVILVGWHENACGRNTKRR